MPGDDPADLHISLGRYNDSIKDISASYREARTAITLAEQMHWSNRLISYDQMGIYRFLASVCDQPETTDDLLMKKITAMETIYILNMIVLFLSQLKIQKMTFQ